MNDLILVHESYLIDLPDFLKEFLIDHSTWNEDVAEKAGLGINAIYRWKNQTPTTDSISKVAKVLNVSTDYLLGASDDPEPSKKNKPTEVDLGEAIKDDYTIMRWKGKQIPPEEIKNGLLNNIN